jgi:hypothetical protein
MEGKNKVQFNSLLVTKTCNLPGADPRRNFLAKEVDAEDVTGEKAAALLRQEEAACRVMPRFRDFSVQQQIQQDEGSAVAPFNAGAATRTAFLFFAGSANVRNAESGRLIP